MTKDFTPSTQALEDALYAIALIVDESESDAQLMSDQLGRIIDAANEGRGGYMRAFIEMQKAELAHLKGITA